MKVEREGIMDIIRYIRFLREEYGLAVSVHGLAGGLCAYVQDFTPYNVHQNPYCMMMKTNRQAWDRCRTCQEALVRACPSKPFWGMCYAGVEEYVFPVFDQGCLGFVSVSGFRVNEKKGLRRLRRAAEGYGLDAGPLRACYERDLSPPGKEAAFYETLLQPLCHMLRLLHKDSARAPVRAESLTAREYVYGHLVLYLEQNFRKKITLDELSRFCHYSVSYISHLFKKRSGKSVSEYVNRLRVEEARRLLAQTNLPVRQITERTGFSDSNYFSNTFKRFCGVSPVDYRKRMKGEGS